MSFDGGYAFRSMTTICGSGLSERVDGSVDYLGGNQPELIGEC